MDGGHVCQDGGGDGGSRGGVGAYVGGGGSWGPWVGDFAAFGVGLEVHSGFVGALPQTPKGRES